MSQNEAATESLADSPVSIYERFTKLYDLMFRFNGYGRSLERYLREAHLPLPAGARILDPGCGTGLLTLALLRVLRRPADITAVDLSGRSLQTARRAVRRLSTHPPPCSASSSRAACSNPCRSARDSASLRACSRPAAIWSSCPSALRPRRGSSKSCSASRPTRRAKSPKPPSASSASSSNTASIRLNLSAGRRAWCWRRSRKGHSALLTTVHVNPRPHARPQTGAHASITLRLVCAGPLNLS